MDPVSRSFHPYWSLPASESPCMHQMCWWLFFFLEMPRRSHQDEEVKFFCPLWVFLRSGLAVPKAVARKPLPQKVSALDPGIGNGHHFFFLPDGAVSISYLCGCFRVRPLLICGIHTVIFQNLRLSEVWPKWGVAFDQLWNTRVWFLNVKTLRGVVQDVS